MTSTKISIRIIVIFIIAIAGSFIPDLYPQFFGDWFCGGCVKHYYGPCLYETSPHNPTWHWGWRHHMFFMMGLVLAAVQVWEIAKKL